LIDKVGPYQKGLSILKELNPVSFSSKGNNNRLHVGLISQDVQQLEPLAVDKNQNGLLILEYEKLIGILINSIKELSNEVDNLKAKEKKKR